MYVPTSHTNLTTSFYEKMALKHDLQYGLVIQETNDLPYKVMHVINNIWPCSIL